MSRFSRSCISAVWRISECPIKYLLIQSSSTVPCEILLHASLHQPYPWRLVFPVCFHSISQTLPRDTHIKVKFDLRIKDEKNRIYAKFVQYGAQSPIIDHCATYIRESIVLLKIRTKKKNEIWSNYRKTRECDQKHKTHRQHTLLCQWRKCPPTNYMQQNTQKEVSSFNQKKKIKKERSKGNLLRPHSSRYTYPVPVPLPSGPTAYGL